MEDIREYLKYINCSQCTYDEWLQVGLGLYHSRYSCDIWEEWSMRDPRFKDGECQRKWDGFKDYDGTNVTVKTIYKMAYERGCPKNLSKAIRRDRALRKDEPIPREDVIEGELHMTPSEQLKTYLRTLYKSKDIVAYVTTDVGQNKDGTYYPLAGVFTRTAGDILGDLEETHDVSMSVGDWHDGAGAWIRVNTYNGRGVRNEDVRSWRYVLVECDTGSLAEQYEMYKKLQLPIACLVHSGGKSLHAIVKVDAKDARQYRERVDFIYEQVQEKGGMKPDSADKNPSRLSRMPGVTRNGVEQSLLAVNIGLKTFSDWRYFITKGEQPAIIEYPINFTERPQLAEELIHGLLRRGHKMLVSGASKANKSFFLIELGIAISQGLEFLGFQCEKGKVLYINMEIDKDSCNDRVIQIARAMGVEKDPDRMFAMKNMRGLARPLEELVDELITEYKDENFAAIIVDPIYKLMTGDENNATDMGAFTNHFDRLCTALGCSVIYSHHHSKGAKGALSILDRMSGSGVFARDPDALIDLTELEVENLPEEMTGWEMGFVVRDFKRIKPLRVIFNYPLHELDHDGLLRKGYTHGSVEEEVHKQKMIKQGAKET
ncbi:MAG: AAA family ATPase [Clostridia bacterium]|nr:AAA family ATPase [Clostridia bacterium]